MVWPYGRCIFNSLRKCQTFFAKWSVFLFYQQYIRVLVFLYSSTFDFCNFSQSNRYIVIFHYDFLNLTSKAKATKQVGLYQTKNLYTAKKTINKMRGQPTKWEKIFENYIPDKGLISKIYIELIQLSSKKPKYPVKQNGQDLSRHFSIENI